MNIPKLLNGIEYGRSIMAQGGGPEVAWSWVSRLRDSLQEAPQKPLAGPGGVIYPAPAPTRLKLAIDAFLALEAADLDGTPHVREAMLGILDVIIYHLTLLRP